METQNYFNQQYAQPSATTDASRAFITQVFTYMTAALAITGVVAYWFATSEALFSLLYAPVTTPEGTFFKPTILAYVAMFSPLIFVFIMGGLVNRMSAMAMVITFVVFSAIMGVSMSSIFRVFSQESISITFFITAGTFAIMSFVGYTTKTDLTRMGNLLMMALLGMILAMVVNWFLKSPGLMYIISIVGVLVFTGLIAYDTQKLKHLGAQIGTGTAMASKMAILGALSLYLDFINLFTFLLHLFGGRNNE